MEGRSWNWPLAALVLLLAAALGLALFAPPKAPQAPADLPAGGDFLLQSADGPLDSRRLRGQVVLLYFGYTYCPDICPTSLTATAQALEALTPAERAQVSTVFVSVDPERDTPARLKEYAAFFHPSIAGATGSPAQVAALAKAYGVIYVRQEPGASAGYAVDHSTWTYVLAPDGRLVGRIAHGSPPARFVAEIRKWLPASPSSKKGNSR